MLIIEIILTIFVWRNGWKWLSLIPMGLALLIGFCVGFGVGMSGGSITGPVPFLSFIDICAVIALIVMLVKKPKTIEINKNN